MPRRHWEPSDISRKLTSFGRHQERPPGLDMDDNGTFTLTNLMDAWGTYEGLDEVQILSAVQQHLLKSSSGPGGAKLRFGIDQNVNGPILIRIAPFGFRL